MNSVELVLVLLASSAVLSVAAERVHRPHPLVLVFGGVGLRVPPRLVTILEGERPVDDATGLVAPLDELAVAAGPPHLPRDLDIEALREGR